VTEQSQHTLLLYECTLALIDGARQTRTLDSLFDRAVRLTPVAMQCAASVITVRVCCCSFRRHCST
jgi:hypothetical protein